MSGDSIIINSLCCNLVVLKKIYVKPLKKFFPPFMREPPSFWGKLKKLPPSFWEPSKLVSAKPRVYLGILFSCYCKLRLVTPHGGAEGMNIFYLITLDCWKRHFREENCIQNYFYLLKSTKSIKTTSQKCWRNIIWADFFGRSYRTNGIKTCLGSLVLVHVNCRKHFKMKVSCFIL